MIINRLNVVERDLHTRQKSSFINIITTLDYSNEFINTYDFILSPTNVDNITVIIIIIHRLETYHIYLAFILF